MRPVSSKSPGLCRAGRCLRDTLSASEERVVFDLFFDSLDRSSYCATAHLSSGATPSSSFPLPTAVSGRAACCQAFGRPTMSCRWIIYEYRAGILVETPATNLLEVLDSSLLPRRGSAACRASYTSRRRAQRQHPQSQKSFKPRVPCRLVTSSGFSIRYPSKSRGVVLEVRRRKIFCGEKPRTQTWRRRTFATSTLSIAFLHWLYS